MSFQCLFKAPFALFCSSTVWSSTGTKVSFGSDTQQWQLAHLWSSYISCNQANSWSKPEKDQSTPLFFVVLLQNKMGVTIESSVWEPSPFLYIFIFLSCFFSIFLLPSKSSSSSSSSLFDHSNSSSFIPFQRNFLLLFSLASGNFIIASFFFFFWNYALILGSVWLRVHVKSDSFFLSDGGLVVGVWRVRIGLLWCGQGTNDVVTVCWILSCALCR